jgi:hypothetical protein
VRPGVAALGVREVRHALFSHMSDTYEDAARLTVELVDHGHTPDELSEAVLEKLIEMAAESKLNIWHRETGLSVESLTALYRLYETGSGYCHARRYADYELGRNVSRSSYVRH